MDESILQYAAGVVDVGGCFKSDHGYKVLLVNCAKKKGDMSTFLVEKFGGKISETASAWIWNKRGDELIEFLKMILPHMLVQKHIAEMFINDDISNLKELKTEIKDVDDSIVPSIPWRAGIIDIVSNFKLEKTSLCLTMSQTNPTVLKLFERLYHGNFSYVQSDKSYRFQTKTFSRIILNDVLPYSIAKKDEIVKVLKDSEKPDDKLPKGVCRIRNKLHARVTYQGKMRIVGTFADDQVKEASECYMKYKTAIEFEKKGGPKVVFE